MTRTPRIAAVAPQIEAFFDSLGIGVFTKKELSSLFDVRREGWQLPTSMLLADFLGYLTAKSHLQEIKLLPPVGSSARKLTRYAWREHSPLELGNSIRKRAYSSHGTAVFVHGLKDEDPRKIFVNAEQSPKPKPVGTLTQEGIDRAFASSTRQRTSSLVYRHEKKRFVVLAGKHTRDAGVIETIDQYGARVRVTTVERTLVDIAVRPMYAGGVKQVLDAYKRAAGRASINDVRSLLIRIDHVYPYHQCIGYYAEKAGFPAHQVERLRSTGINFDFYLAHGMKKPRYVPRWRLYVPKSLEE